MFQFPASDVCVCLCRWRRGSATSCWGVRGTFPCSSPASFRLSSCRACTVRRCCFLHAHTSAHAHASIHRRTHVRTHAQGTSTALCVHTCMLSCTSAHIYVQAHTYRVTRRCLVCTRARTHVPMRIHVYTSACIDVESHTCSIECKMDCSGHASFSKP